MRENEDISNLIELDEEAFLTRVSNYLLEDTFGSAPINKPHKLEMARKWINSQIEVCRTIICGNTQVRSICDTESTMETIAKSIFDALTAKYTIIPASFIAVHLAKSGVRIYCADEWKNTDE